MTYQVLARKYRPVNFGLLGSFWTRYWELRGYGLDDKDAMSSAADEFDLRLKADGKEPDIADYYRRLAGGKFGGVG
jgi:hypothetical protein